MDECSQHEQVFQEDLEIKDFDSNLLFDRLHDLIGDVNRLRQQAKEKMTRAIHQYSGSDDDISSGESGDEEEVTQQQETMEDLQAEIAQLEISEEASTLETLIIIVEHYAKTGDVSGFQKNVRRPDMWLMTSPRPKVSDIVKMADNLGKQNLPFRAVLMYKCACTLYKYDYVHYPTDATTDDIIPDDAVRGIEKCMEKVFEIFYSIIHRDGYEVYFPHFVPVAYDMLTNLREIHHSDRKLKADLEMWGMLYIAIIHGRLKQVTEMRDVSDSVVKTIQRRFKHNANRRLVYGVSLLALSVAKRLQGNSTESSESSADALKALQEADDFPNWDDKVEVVDKVGKFTSDMQKLNV